MAKDRLMSKWVSCALMAGVALAAGTSQGGNCPWDVEDVGDYYWAGGRKVKVLRVRDEVGVRLKSPSGMPALESMLAVGEFLDKYQKSGSFGVNGVVLRRPTRRSAIRCSTNFMMASKNPRMSASSTQFTFLVSNPVYRASSALCWLRPGRKPYEKPRKSVS